MSASLLWLLTTVALVWSFLLFRASRVASLVALLLAFLAPLTIWPPPFDTRPLGLLAVLALAVLHPAEPTTSFMTKHHRTLLGVVPLVAVMAISLAWTVDLRRSIDVVASWAILLSVGMIVLGRMALRDVHRAANGVLIGVLVVSSALVAGRYPAAMSGERAQGLMSNPNGLGIVCALSIPAILSARRRGSVLFLVVPLTLVVISGSRSGVLACLVALSIFAYHRAGQRGRLLLTPFLALIPLTASDSLAQFASERSNLPLFRTNDSRGELWRQVWELHQERPWLGLGAGALDIVGGNSYLKALAELGYLGALAAAIAVGSYTAIAWRRPDSASFLLAGLASAFFESWLFAAGSFYAVVTYLMLLAWKVEGDNRARGVDSKQSQSAVQPCPERHLGGPPSSRTGPLR
jgi:O-antigen ligase